MEEPLDNNVLPRYTWDLIELLNQTVEPVEPPRSAAELAAFRDNLDTWFHKAGRRSLVDELMALKEEMNAEAQQEPVEGAAAPTSILDTPILNTNAGIPRRAPPTSVVRTGTGPLLGDDDQEE